MADGNPYKYWEIELIPAMQIRQLGTPTAPSKQEMVASCCLKLAGVSSPRSETTKSPQ